MAFINDYTKLSNLNNYIDKYYNDLIKIFSKALNKNNTCDTNKDKIKNLLLTIYLLNNPSST